MALIPSLTGIYQKIGGLPLGFGDPRFKVCAYQLGVSTFEIAPALRVEEPSGRERSRLAQGSSAVELYGNELYLYGVPGTLPPNTLMDSQILIGASDTGDRWLAAIWADPLLFEWEGPVSYRLLVRPKEYR